MQGGMDVVDYYAKSMDLWSKLENQVRFSCCSCGKCECGIFKKLVKMVGEEKVHQFLMGLNDEVYSNI